DKLVTGVQTCALPILSAGWLRLNGRRALLRGSFLFLAGVIAMALSPWYGLAFMLLVIGGLGTAAFATMQTSLVLTEAPPAATSQIGRASCRGRVWTAG